MDLRNLPFGKLLKVIETVAPLTGLPGAALAGKLAGAAEHFFEAAKANTGMDDAALEAHIDAALDSAQSKAEEDAAKGM